MNLDQQFPLNWSYPLPRNARIFEAETGGPMRNFAVAGLQLDLAKDGNLPLVAEQVRAAKRRLPWLDMIVVSELACHGVSTALAERMPGRTEEELCAIARENAVWLVGGTLFERAGDRIYNTAPVIDPSGAVVARYRKMFPFYPYEQGVAPGDDLCVFDVPNVGRFGMTICYDIWFPEIARSLAFMGAEAILNPSLTNTIDRDQELAFARATAASNQCYVINVNGAGKLGWGKSIACGPGGEILHQSASAQEAFALDLDLDLVTRVRERGWNGLGQVLKSFRDHPIDWPAYRPGARSQTLEALGPLKKPESS